MPNQLTVGDVLRTSLTVIQRNVGTFIALALIVAVPNLVIGIASALLTRTFMPEFMPVPGTAPNVDVIFDNIAFILPIYFASLGVILVTYTVSQAGMTYTAVEHMAGRQAGAVSAMTAAFRSLPSLIASAFLVGILTFVGTLFCFAPGIIAALYFCLAGPAILVERIGPIAGMQRSIDLTEGNKTSIFLIFLALFGAVLAFSLCVMGPLTAAVTLGLAAPGTVPDPLHPAQLALQLVSMVVNGAMSAFGTTTVAVIYARIRGIRDGVDAEAFARMFA